MTEQTPRHPHPPALAAVQRKERPGLGLALAAVGSVTMLVGLFLPWAQVWRQVPYGERTDEETTGVFSMVDVVEEVTEGARRAPTGGAVADAFFPVLAIALTVACCLVALLAGFGLRHRVMTNAGRVVGTLLVGGTGLVAVAALFQVGAGFSSDYETKTGNLTSGGDEAGRADMVSQVITHYGFWLWVGGGALLALAAVLGPRVRYRLPDGTEILHPSLAVSPGPGALPGPFATQPVAALLGAVGAVLCFAGYVFLPWGEATTFGDISGVVRDHGIDDHPIASAYFGWAGWILLLGTLVAAVLLLMGRRPFRFRPASARRFLIGGTVVAVLFHLVALIDGEVFEDLDAGSITVSVGLGLALVSSLLPLRPLLPAHAPPPPAGPGPGFF